MRREHIMARLLRAISGKSQEQFGKETGIHSSLVAQFELGTVIPSRDHLELMAVAVALSVPAAEEVLRLVETLQRPCRRRETSAEILLEEIAEGIRSQVHDAYRRLLTLSLPETLPRAEDRIRAGELFERLESLPPEVRLAVVQVAEEWQTWALCERSCDASIREASRNLVLWHGSSDTYSSGGS
jgi:transcriptional regulator with XRE-family HTH domain